MMRQRPWLFKKTPNIDLGGYMKYFEEYVKGDFFLFPAMLPYKKEIIDKYKDNVFNTMFLPAAGGNLSLHTIIQVNEKYHLFLLWANGNDNMDSVFYVTLYVTETDDYRKFLVENESFIYEENSAKGFAGLMTTTPVGFGQ